MAGVAGEGAVSRRAIEANINIMRAFVRLRQMLVFSDDSLKTKVEELEKKYDANFKMIFDAIRALMSPPTATPKEIGFRPSSRHAGSTRRECRDYQLNRTPAR